MSEKAKHQPTGRKTVYWVLAQHDEISVLEQRERPDTTAVPGERLKSAFGPYFSRDAATAKRDALYSRTHKAQLERLVG